MNVNAGELNKRIAIYRKPELDEDGYLPENPAPILVHNCWAKFSQTSGTEMVKAKADVGEAKARFLIRYTRKKINRKMFVRYKGLDYEIVYINPYGDSGEWIEIWCKWESNEEGGANAGREDSGGGETAGS